jgi:hypothetical protein
MLSLIKQQGSWFQNIVFVLGLRFMRLDSRLGFFKVVIRVYEVGILGMESDQGFLELLFVMVFAWAPSRFSLLSIFLFSYLRSLLKFSSITILPNPNLNPKP